MSFGSVCSGIEAASVAAGLENAGCAWLAEVEPFPCAVLNQRLGATAPENPPYWLNEKELANWRKTIAKNIHGGALRNIGDMTVLPELIRAGKVEAPDVLVGGTPCQAFSVAGKRRGLEDLRGNLTLCFAEILNAIDDARTEQNTPGAVCVWENVPGVLSDKTNAFGCFLAEIAGYPDPLETESGKWPRNGEIMGPRRRVAWATLDAQYFGVPQRRRRVWLVAVPNATPSGGAMAWPDPSEILALGSCLRRDTPQGRETGEEPTGVASQGVGVAVDCGTQNDARRDVSRELAPAISINWMEGRTPYYHTDGTPAPDTGGSHWDDPQHPHPTLQARDYKGFCNQDIPSGRLLVPTPYGPRMVSSWCDGDQLADTLTANNANGAQRIPDKQNFGGVLAPLAISENQRSEVQLTETHRQLTCGGGKPGQGYPAVLVGVPFDKQRLGSYGNGMVSSTLTARDYKDASDLIAASYGVRRLTPIEAERLQGFPDNWTRIKWGGKPEADCPDGHRYKAIGNSWAVPVARWVFERIEACAPGEVA